MTPRPDQNLNRIRLWAGLLLLIGGAAPCQAQGPARTATVAPVPLGPGGSPQYGTLPGANAPVSIAPAPGFVPGPFGPTPLPPGQFPPTFSYVGPGDGRAVIVSPAPTVVAPGIATYPGPYPIYMAPYPGAVSASVPMYSGMTPQPVPHDTFSIPTGSESLTATPRRVGGPANFDVSVSEEFLNRLVARERLDPGPVQDVILGAQVTGQQTTRSRLTADLLPSDSNARIALLLNGNVHSLTTGVTPQAMIDTSSQQRFHAIKEVYFDGVQFSTRHATVFIRAENQTLGATTPLTGTLLGGMANRIAYRAAERQKTAGEAVARDRLAERLFPTFDGEVDANLARLNRQLAPVRQRLDALKLLPETQSTWTDDQQFRYQCQLGVSARVTPQFPDTIQGLRISLHESLLNSLVDRSGLAGFKTTDKQLRALEGRFLSVFGGVEHPRDEDSSNPLGATSIETEIEFDESDPIRFRFDQNQLIVTLKAHFKPAGQNVVPPVTVTIPFENSMVGANIRWTPGTPRVVAQDRTDPDGPPTLVETAIQKAIEADLDTVEFPRTLPASAWQSESPAPAVTSVRTERGWLTILAQ